VRVVFVFEAASVVTTINRLSCHSAESPVVLALVDDGLPGDGVFEDELGDELDVEEEPEFALEFELVLAPLEELLVGADAGVVVGAGVGAGAV
jgi:hypothetical protein